VWHCPVRLHPDDPVLTDQQWQRIAKAQVLDVLADLQRELGMAAVLVIHDFGVVQQMCSDLVVMYRVRVVETGPTQQVLTGATQPLHPGADHAGADDAGRTRLACPRCVRWSAH
jgi:ABC-type glutathione transport system ATPase component